MQEDAGGGGGVGSIEQRTVHQGPGYGLFELLFCLAESAHVVEIGGWGFGDVLPHRAGFDGGHRALEVGACDFDISQRVAGLSGSPKRGHCCLLCQRFEIRTHEAVGPGGKFLNAHVAGQRHPTGVDIQDLASTGLAGNTDLDLSIESSAASQGGIE